MADCKRKTANLFDIEKWLTDRGISYTIVDGIYEFYTGISLNNNVYYFANDNISVSISGSIEAVTANSPYITLVNKDGGNAKTTALSPAIIKSENILCAGLKFDWNTGGKVRLSNIMLNEGSTALPYEPYGWVHSLRKLGTDTDTITTLPADIYTDGQPIGANLFDKTTWDNVTATRGTVEVMANGIKLTATGNDAYTQTYNNVDYAYPVTAGKTYTLSWNIDNPNVSGQVFLFSGVTSSVEVLTNVYASGKKVTFTIPSEHNYLSFRLGVTTSGDSLTYTNIMLNEGNTALPYQPYAPTIIKGNMSQTGTPTPTTSIQPQETGERTENLLDADIYYGTYKQADGTYQSTRANLYNVQIKPFTAADIGKTFTFVADITPITGNARLCANINGTIVSGSNTEKSVVTFTVETTDDSIFFNYGSGSTTVTTLSDIMLVEGSTAPSSYIPYGYKLDISSGGKNLFDKDSTQYSTVGYVREDGTFGENNNYGVSGYIQLSPNTQYTVSDMNVNGLYPAICFYTENKTFISGIKYNGLTMLSFTTPINCKYVLMSYLKSNINIIMLNRGGASLPYEPYNRTITPVYLGEVQSTRNVRQIILKGGEISTVDTSVGQALLSISDTCLGVAPISSHYKGKVVTAWTQLSDGECGLLNNGTTIRICDTTNVTSAPNYNQYLAQQYAAGTPVTVWYVLATETTGVVNEPLRKIGDYADSVSVTNIPTTSGGIEFDVDTTLKPSEVSLSYTGWHDASVKEKSENLFDYSDLSDGSISTTDGVTIVYNGQKHTDSYVSVKSSTNYAVSGLAPDAVRIHEYTSDYIYLGSNVYSQTFSTQSTCAYIRISGAHIPELLMINEGSTALPYEPYWK